MINYMINFIQSNSIIILVILSSLVLLSLASKRFRAFMYGGIITSSISLAFAVMHKMGYGFTTFYVYFEKTVYTVTRGIEEAQSLLSTSKTIFQATVVSLSSDDLVKSLYLNDTFYSFTLDLLIIDLRTTIDDIKISLNARIEIIKEFISVKKTNKSRLSLVYRC